MAISFVNKGSFAAVVDTNTSSPTIPASMQAGDFMVLVVETEGASISVSAGWTLAGSQLNRGTANNAGGVRLAVYTRAWVSGDAAPTVTTTGAGHAVSMIFGFRGVDTTTPLDGVTPTTTSQAASTTLTMPGITTATGNAVVVHCMALDRDLVSSNTVTGNPTNANLTFTGFGTSGELHDQIVADRRGGGIFVAAGLKVVAGATGNTSATQASSAYLGITLSLRAAVPGGASANLTLGRFTVSGTSTVTGRAASANLTLGRFTVSGTTTTTRAATANLTFDPFTVSGTATVVSAAGVSASANLTLDPFTLSGTVATTRAATANLTFDPLTVSGTTTVVTVTGVTANASLVFDPLTASGTSTVTGRVATASLTFDPLTSSGTVATTRAATANLTLDPLTSSGTVATTRAATASLTFNPLTVSGTATVVSVTNTNASANLTFDPFFVTGLVTSAVADNTLDSRKLFRLRRSTRWRDRFYRV